MEDRKDNAGIETAQFVVAIVVAVQGDHDVAFGQNPVFFQFAF